MVARTVDEVEATTCVVEFTTIVDESTVVKVVVGTETSVERIEGPVSVAFENDVGIGKGERVEFILVGTLVGKG